MATTKSYGNWTRVTGDVTLNGMIADTYLPATTVAQLELITDTYRAAINAALPDSVSLCGDEFYGNAYEADCADQAAYPHDEDGSLDLAAIIEGVDLGAIAYDILGW